MATAEASDFGTAFIEAVAAAERSVVRVQASSGATSSGTVWSADGLLIASQRAIGDADELHVFTREGELRAAELIGADPALDLSLLRVSGSALPPLAFEPPDALRVGQWTLALGRPGEAIRASARIVGVLAPALRSPLGAKLDRYVETDRGFPHGFAGGPLVDLRGRGLGMNTPFVLRGADLTVPAPALQRAVDELLAHGKVRRGYLGVGVQPVRLPAALHAAAGAQRGVIVLSVAERSPAAAAGLLLGDVIVQLDGRAVEDPRELSAVLEDALGRELVANIVRAGSVRDVSVTPGERP